MHVLGKVDRFSDSDSDSDGRLLSSTEVGFV